MLDDVIHTALLEDLGAAQDWTSSLLIDRDHSGNASIVAKQEGVLAGISVAKAVFEHVDDRLKLKNRLSDGARLQPGVCVFEMSGALQSILTAERTALNFLQRLSGIATLTSRFVGQVQGTGVTILDTRKTTPGLRELEKQAVRIGGGDNHRFGLYDMILIKENHIQAAGSIPAAVTRIREALAERHLSLRIEIEVRTLDELEIVLPLNVDRVMLDNMSVVEIKEAVKRVCSGVELEVSGGVTLETVRNLAETGVDFISVGALTHSAPAMDFSLLVD